MKNKIEDFMVFPSKIKHELPMFLAVSNILISLYDMFVRGVRDDMKKSGDTRDEEELLNLSNFMKWLVLFTKMNHEKLRKGQNE